MEVDTEGALFLKPAEYSPILKEIYNFHTVAALLAGYGFDCVRLANDWGGADFLAYPQEDGHEILKIQLKGRPTINKKYQGPEKKIYMAFPIDEIWYLILHDKLVQLVEKHTNWTKTKSWSEGEDYGHYHNSAPNKNLKQALSPFKLKPPVGINDRNEATKELKTE